MRASWWRVVYDEGYEKCPEVSHATCHMQLLDAGR
jgi:hypothetical protein